MFLANFADDHDIADPAVIAAALEALGQSASLMSYVDSSEAKAKLRTATERAISLQIFGAPSFLVGAELFWGNDRLETAVAWACR